MNVDLEEIEKKKNSKKEMSDETREREEESYLGISVFDDRNIKRRFVVWKKRRRGIRLCYRWALLGFTNKVKLDRDGWCDFLFLVDNTTSNPT